MKHITTIKFEKSLRALPKHIQQIARKNYKLLEENPRHPSLNFKKVKGMKGHYSFRVGRSHRAIGDEKDGVVSWHRIASHGKYEKLIK